MFRLVGVTCLLVICVGFFAYNVEAQEDTTGTIYIQVQSGYSGANEPDIKLDNVLSSSLGKTLLLGGGGAYQLTRNIRADFTITYRGGFEQNVEFGQDLKAKADFQSTAFMVSATYEFTQFRDVTPYVMGGFGYVYNQLDQVTITENSSPVATIRSGGWANFGGQFGGGVEFTLSNDWAVDAGYRYFDGGKYESSGYILLAEGENRPFTKEEGDLSANEIVVGLRIRIR